MRTPTGPGDDLRIVGSGRDGPSRRPQGARGADDAAMTVLEMAREADEIQFGFRPK